MLFFNAENGYLDGILRGYRSALITRQQYHNFTQCENLDDLKVQLQTTDYGEYLMDLASPVKPEMIGARLREAMIDRFQYIRGNAGESLGAFLDYARLSYMIDNVVLIIGGMQHGEEGKVLLEQCHPLGHFESMAALTVTRSLEEVYSLVLIDSPLAPYFQTLLIGSNNSESLEDVKVEIIRNRLYRAWLEDWNQWIESNCDDQTIALMGPLLAFEADRRTMAIALNAQSLSRDDRLSMMPRLGSLWQADALERLARIETDDELRGVLEEINPSLARLLTPAGAGNAASDPHSNEFLLYRHEVELCKESFDRLFTLAPFYCWMRLQEIEQRNVVWIAECILQQQKELIGHYLEIF